MVCYMVGREKRVFVQFFKWMVQKENTIVVIVTYNPTNSLSHLLDRCRQIAYKVVIVDNGSSNFVVQKNDENNLEIVKSAENKGIAWGLNVGIRKALEYHPKWIISFDQDSLPALNILDAYNDVIKSSNEQIGLISGGFHLVTDKTTFPISYKNSIRLITSGMLHNVDVFERVGFYEEKLFIDNVDFDFVMRVHRSHFLTIEIQNDIIQHKIGNPIKRRWGNISVESSNHNAMRRYYQARNLVYITRKYIWYYPFQIINFNYYYFFKILPRMCFVERPLKSKIKSVCKGLWDGLFF